MCQYEVRMSRREKLVSNSKLEFSEVELLTNLLSTSKELFLRGLFTTATFMVG